MKKNIPVCSTASTSQQRILLVALVVLLNGSIGRADTLFYLTADGVGEGAAPVSSPELKFLPSGGSFHIWVQPDALFTGISLDVTKTGSAIRFTGSTVHNPTIGTDERWLDGLVRDGTVTDGKVSRIEGGALAPLTGFGTGIGPTTASSDPLYESAGGFLFATIDFEVPSPTETSTVSLSVGHNLLSDTGGLTTSMIVFGLGDTAVTNSVGSTGSAVDLDLSARPLHPSDFDMDGDVDGDDLLAWQDGFGITSGATKSEGDGNGDGKVDGADLALWESQYSTAPASPITAVSAVPEPTSVWILGCGLLAHLASAARRRSSY